MRVSAQHLRGVFELFNCFFSLKYLLLLPALFLLGCSDDAEETTLVAQDFILRVDENPEENMVLGKMSASTNKGTINYRLMSQFPANSISLNSASGEIKVKNVAHFDFQKNQSVDGVVRVSNGELSKTVNIIIKVNNVNEVTLSDFTTSIYENPEEYQLMGTVEATTEVGNILYSIVSQSPENSFFIIPDTGEIIVDQPSNYSYEKNQVITGEIMANSRGASDVAQVTITILKLEPGQVVGDFVIENQTDLDEFAAGNYNLVTGSLFITYDGNGDPFTSLKQLSGLTQVSSNLTISDVSSLTDLSGLENLTNAGGIIISNNSFLSNVDALSNVNTALFLEFSNNERLDDFCGLQNILTKHKYIESAEAAKSNTVPPLPPFTFTLRDNKANPKIADILALDCN
ncbi:cadherin repeat domain-containing protein [Lutimonas sp.]|uniref:cadherin repeat domain-containing protein n=1 Tax=Lutimonas sp. TaxID=1872403 RepID=UPI003D9B88C9